MNPTFSKWTEDNVRKIKYLAPEVRELFLEFILRIADEGIYVRIPDDGAHRTAEQQLALYKKIPKVTGVLCPHSFHCHGLAIDVVPLQKIGVLQFKALWNRVDLYERMARIARELNIQWGFQLWGVDKPHFHYSGGKTIEQIIKGNYPKKPSFKRVQYHKETQRVIQRLKNNGTITYSIFPYLYDEKARLALENNMV